MMDQGFAYENYEKRNKSIKALIEIFNLID
jgi:hypothetical protein